MISAPKIVKQYKRVLARLHAKNADEILDRLKDITIDAHKLGIEISEEGGYNVRWRSLGNSSWHEY